MKKTKQSDQRKETNLRQQLETMLDAAKGIEDAMRHVRSDSFKLKYDAPEKCLYSKRKDGFALICRGSDGSMYQIEYSKIT